MWITTLTDKEGQVQEEWSESHDWGNNLQIYKFSFGKNFLFNLHFYFKVRLLLIIKELNIKSISNKCRWVLKVLLTKLSIIMNKNIGIYLAQSILCIGLKVTICIIKALLSSFYLWSVWKSRLPTDLCDQTN